MENRKAQTKQSATSPTKGLRQGFVHAAWTLLLCILPLLPACHPPTPTPAPTKALYPYGAFAGNLPCADCAGIREKLSLWTVGPDDFSVCRFRLDDTYLDTRDGDQTFTTEGDCVLERGSGDNPDDMVFALDMGHGQESRYVVEDADTLAPLSHGDNKRIDAPMDLRLHRVR